MVNDGSPDTPELEKALAPYASRIVYIRQPNKRAAGARNTAIAQARGEFLAFLDSDDVWLPGHLESQMKLFKDDSSLDLVYADSIVSDPEQEWKFTERCPSQGPATFSALVVERCQIPVSTVVARKSAIVRAGLFDESLARCDDYDMWLRTAFHGAKIAYAGNVQARLAGERPGALGVSRARMAEGYWIILDKALRTLPLSEAERALVTKRAEEIRARYLVEEAKQQLRARQFGKARELLVEANRYFKRRSLMLTIFGLGIAPGTTTELIGLWNRIRNGSPA